MESALVALSVGHSTRGRCPGDDRRVYHSRLHGHGHGPRRLHFDYSRRSVHGLGENPPPPLVRAGHQGAIRREIKDRSGRTASPVEIRLLYNPPATPAHLKPHVDARIMNISERIYALVYQFIRPSCGCTSTFFYPAVRSG